MAKKQEAILEVKLEQRNLISDLEKQKRSIVGSKTELQELNKAYKQGSITLEEYAQDAVRLEAILKKQSAAYLNTQKAVTGHKSKIDELIKSNNKLSSSLGDAAGQLEIAGVNVGSLTSKIAAFANPATAAVGLVSALSAAYARSTIGAKDLEFAHNQLAAATTLVSNSFASMISSAEDGQGLFSKIVGGLINQLSPTLAAQSGALAVLGEQAEDLGRKEIIVRGDISDRLADNQEKLTAIADEQTRYNDKLQLSNEIVNNLKKNQTELRGVLTDQLQIIQVQLNFDKNNDSLLTLKLQKEREINKVVSDTAKKIEAQNRATNNLIEAERKRLQQQGVDDANADISVRALNDDSTVGLGRVSGVTPTANANLDISKRIEKTRTDFQKEQSLQRSRTKQAEIEFAIEQDKKLVQSTQEVFSAMAGIFAEGSELQKGFALISLGIDTAEAIGKLTAASEGNPGNSFTFGGAGIAQYLSGLARIFANIASAKRFLGGSFADGGWTGPGGKYDAAGVVHADEYVTPKRIVNNPMARPHLHALESMRVKGYADGGFVANQNIAGGQNTLAMINAMKRMPHPEVSVREIVDKSRSILLREKTARIGGKL